MNLKLLKKISDKDCKKLLLELIEKLDELDYEDFFGTEGWRHFLGYED
jgi:hypothetical protein